MIYTIYISIGYIFVYLITISSSKYNKIYWEIYDDISIEQLELQN